MNSMHSPRPTSSAELPVLPHSLRQALAFLRTNFQNKVTLANVASACGLSRRAVERQFENFLGVSPIAHLLRMRLTAVHDQLRQSDGSASISEVAARCGISHMGRFAIDYRKAFGELPSATVKRAFRIPKSNGRQCGDASFPVPFVARGRRRL